MASTCSSPSGRVAGSVLPEADLVCDGHEEQDEQHVRARVEARRRRADDEARDRRSVNGLDEREPARLLFTEPNHLDSLGVDRECGFTPLDAEPVRCRRSMRTIGLWTYH